MAVALEFINFIVPIQTIRAKYPGGWEACLRDHESLIGGRVWFDEHLFRDGAMNPADIKSVVERWEAMGFDTIVEANGKKMWRDVCVVEAMFGGPTLPCDWLEFDGEQRIAYLRGCEPGGTVGREEMRGAGHDDGGAG